MERARFADARNNPGAESKFLYIDRLLRYFSHEVAKIIFSYYYTVYEDYNFDSRKWPFLKGIRTLVQQRFGRVRRSPRWCRELDWPWLVESIGFTRTAKVSYRKRFLAGVFDYHHDEEENDESKVEVVPVLIPYSLSPKPPVPVLLPGQPIRSLSWCALNYKEIFRAWSVFSQPTFYRRKERKQKKKLFRFLGSPEGSSNNQ